MIGDKERREAVEFLRTRNAALCSPVYCGKCKDVSRFIFGDTVELCILESRVGLKSWRRLADLIDRPTCHMDLTETIDTNHGEIRIWECSECGQECEEVNGAYEHCPHCGAEVLDGTVDSSD